MSERKLRGLACAAILIGCGSSSGNDLFGSGPRTLPCLPGTAEPCATGSGCPAHRACRSNGTGFEACACDPSGAGSGGGGSPGAGGDLSTTGGFGGELFPGSGGAPPYDSGGSGGALAPPCPAGSFNGTAMGSNYNSSLGTKINVTATIAFTVDQTGTINGTYTGVSPGKSSAELSGSMDCATSSVTIAVRNGAYPASLFPPSPGGTFSGTLTGAYAPDAATFTGQWTIQEANPAYGGQGSWTAN